MISTESVCFDWLRVLWAVDLAIRYPPEAQDASTIVLDTMFKSYANSYAKSSARDLDDAIALHK